MTAVSVACNISNDSPYFSSESLIAADNLFAYNEVNLPSSSTATGMFVFLYFSSSGAFTFSRGLIIAGVPIVLALADELSKIVLRMPSASTVSIEFTNWPDTKPRFLLMG